MNKYLIGGLILFVLLAAGSFYIFNQPEVVTEDVVIDGDYDAPNLILKGGATLTVKGNLLVEKTIACESGALAITVEGNLDVKGGTLQCRGDNAAVNLVVVGDVNMDGTVISDGHVQIVKDEADLLTTDEEFEQAYVEAGSPSGDGPRFGPFVEGGTVSSLRQAPMSFTSAKNREDGFISSAYAEEARDKDGNVIPDVVIGGDWIIGEGGLPPEGVDIDTPGKKVKRIVLNFNFGANGNVQLKDFHLVGPAGRDGESDEGKNCNARGGKGEDAMRFRVHAKNVQIDNFRVELGNGGAGGTAETTKDCDQGVAKGGDGGEAGNMKMTAEQGITINSMTLVPGVGGNGGTATAYGKDGTDACPGEKGGDATATGGNGGKNKKELSSEGAVSGIANVSILEVTGGIGGSAYAYPGKGGNGTGCKCAGGTGGKATATGGKGGDASVKTSGVGNAGATGGDGGDAESVGGAGGNGGHCPLKPSGGQGGKGGDATSREGKGGKGTTGEGSDGNVNREKGGDGGNGGDGCGPGNGGSGGKGREPGTDGKPGKLVCPVDEDQPVTDPGETGGDGTTPGGTGGGGNTGGGTSGGETDTKTIKVIRYQGKYLPVDQLIIEDEIGCGAEHWHAAQGVVVATDGTQVPDPGPQCGFGKVSENPAMEYKIQFNFRIQ